MHFAKIILLSSLLAFSIKCMGEVSEEIIDVPVKVRNIYGREIDQTIKVTTFHDPSKPKSPYIILNHGRATDRADFAKTPRFRFSQISKYFVSLGFAVLVPTRVGYGESGGPDVEDSGLCEARSFEPVYAAAASESSAVINYSRHLPYVDSSHGLAVGQSFGGATSITLASYDLPGLAGAVNFSGGGGGNPETRPENPCSSGRLKQLFSNYGKSAKVKTLWLYSTNDRFWGADLPKEWFDTYQRNGGKGKFISLPPFKENGHAIFTGNPAAWQKDFEAFIQELGFSVEKQ
jgi:dienelactone hydrolase